MSEHINKQLSACLDGELPPSEWELLARRIVEDETCCRTLGRYVLIGEVMRGSSCGVVIRGDLAGQVSRAIRGEPNPAAVSGGFLGSHARRLVAGSGVAAAVAVLAIVSLQSTQSGPGGAASEVSGQASMATDISYTVPRPPDRMTSYLVRHGNYAQMARKSAWTQVVAQDQAAPAPKAAEDKRKPESEEKE
jgi:hypothetical protein